MGASELYANFKALDPSGRDELLRLLLADEELRADLQDFLIIEARRDEGSRPLDEVLSELGA
jgi:hypothetical protein